MVTNDLPAEIDGMPVLRLLGEGGMGQVFACQEDDQSTVAVKVLLPALARDREMVERFAREAQALTSVTSPHVVAALRTGSWEHGPYLVMELLEGQTLRDRVQAEERLSITEATEHIEQTALGLRAAHQAGIVHRDVKPENLFLTDAGVKVVDFGLARPLDGSANLTTAGLIVGSPAYVAPERSRGEDATVKSDIYALGASLFELLAGRPPYDGKSEAEVLSAHIVADLPDIRTFRPGVPDELAELVERMLEKEPEQRVGSYDAVLAVLERVPTAEPEQPAEPIAAPADAAPSSSEAGDTMVLDAGALPGDAGVTIALAGGAHPARLWWEATQALLAWAGRTSAATARHAWQQHRVPTVAGLVVALVAMGGIGAWALGDDDDGGAGSAEGEADAVAADPRPVRPDGTPYPEHDIRGWTIKELSDFLGDEDIDDILAELKKRPPEHLFLPMSQLVVEGSYLRRHRALQILEKVGRATEEHHQTVAVRDIENGPSCAARSEGLELLTEHAVDEQALAAVDRLKRRRSANRCLDLEEAEGIIRDRLAEAE